MTEQGYKLIPMSEITKEAREIAVAWMECEDKNWIGQKHKLASDIMNYSRLFAESSTKELQSEITKLREEVNKWKELHSDLVELDKFSNNMIKSRDEEISELKSKLEVANKLNWIDEGDERKYCYMCGKESCVAQDCQDNC